MPSDGKALFEPITIGKVRLDNRVALAPTYVGMGDHRGNVTDQILCYYYARAIGGVGLIIVEITGVTGRYAFSPGYGLGIGSDSHIPGMRDLAQVIHWGGAKAFLQLLPGQGAQALWSQEKRPLVAPSDVPACIPVDELPEAVRGLRDKRPERPRPLTTDEIMAIKISVVRAADRAKRAGFDGVELHGAHGYLLAQFTSPYFNRRDDEYGGSPEKRWTLSIELIRAIRKAVGPDFVIGYRFSAREWISGGLDLLESIQMAKAIEGGGADYLSISHGCYGSVTHIFPRGEGSMTSDAAAIQRDVSIPVMCPNFQDPSKATEAIANGSVSIIALSRALLADPLWARKVKDGTPKTIQRCIRCYHCVRAAIVDYLPVRCPANPGLGFERFDSRYIPHPEAKSRRME
jgi:2,4-dienoyl-CoA reductase-like NADH-dependent reductase (Old Yellow Enzyme family)